MLQTLAIIGDSRGRDYLIDLLPDERKGLKVTILGHLGAIADDASKDAIKKCLNDPEPEVRELAKKLTDACVGKLKELLVLDVGISIFI